MAGVVLHEGKVAEQKTGEGKTLSATAPLFLNALIKKGVHLVTVNDYLARRDAGWMGSLFHFLGMTTSAIISDKSFIFDPSFFDPSALDWRLQHLRLCSRKEAYQADITYGINSEFGFDYLRDNMAISQEETVQRGFWYAIIDEADSVLIDEARTPHIISAPFDQDTSKYYQYAQIVRSLEPTKDYIIDEKLRTANLTEPGIAHIESMIGVSNIYEKDFETLFHIEAALKAETLYKNNKEYIVRNGEVLIVDEFTGRLLEGRRFSEGIHQAIEAKEKAQIQRESKTLATVSLQNYFRMYSKIGGMTGTASTEAEEFHKIYHMEVVSVPTHRPMVRKDKSDMIYKTEKAKFEAVADEIERQYKVGRPVLVGTTSIEKNEELSHLLKKRGVHHELLNAKNHEREATIISRAGMKGAITVATNMAGRGVDILLGGQPPSSYEKKEKDSSSKKMQPYEELYREWQQKHEEVVQLGGLFVIGTERHESRRIDNQLRGRSGRQGDPGETCFYVSLEDDLMRIFGGDHISRLMTAFNFPEDQALTHPMVSRAIEQAQVKVEGFNFDMRKHLVDYDDVLNKQRDIVYRLRRSLVNASTDESQFEEVVKEVLNDQVQEFSASFSKEMRLTMTDDEIDRVIHEAGTIFPIPLEQIRSLYTSAESSIEVDSQMNTYLRDAYEKKKKELGSEVWKQVVQMVFLSTIDTLWTEHLTAIEDLREGINLRGYAQLDPLIEYKNEAFRMFESLIRLINTESTRRLFRVQMTQPENKRVEEKRRRFQSASGQSAFQVAEKSQAASNKPNSSELPASHAKLGRNDPCWCGSGKKYKRCHYPQ